MQNKFAEAYQKKEQRDKFRRLRNFSAQMHSKRSELALMEKKESTDKKLIRAEISLKSLHEK